MVWSRSGPLDIPPIYSNTSRVENSPGRVSKLPPAKPKYLRVLEMKQTTSVSELCVDLPTEFADYMNYVHNLCDEDRPDCRSLRKMFNDLFHQQGFEYDNVCDWTIREFQRLEAGAQQPVAPDSVEEVVV